MSNAHPDIFTELGAVARARGFKWVVSAPFARSSYHAEMSEEETIGS